MAGEYSSGFAGHNNLHDSELNGQFTPETTRAYFIVDWDTINTILGSFLHSICVFRYFSISSSRMMRFASYVHFLFSFPDYMKGRSQRELTLTSFFRIL